jgi:RND family efflux transporter MFP subunit
MNLKLIILINSIFFLSCSKKEEVALKPTYKVKSVIVKYASGDVTKNYPGEIRATDRSIMSFEIPGRIINSNRKEGELVKKGEVLAQIEVTDYKLNLDKATAAFKNAKAEFERAKILWASEAISKSEFDSHKAAYISTKSEMEKVAKNYRNTTLRAPYDGMVGKVFVKNFEEVKEKQEVIRFYDPNKLEVMINVPESHLAKMDRKQKMDAIASIMDRPDQKMNLTFKEMSSVVDPKTRSYEAVFLLEMHPGLFILPGMTVNVFIKRSGGENINSKVALLPSIAVLEDSQKNKFVWVIDMKNYLTQKRIVTVGNISGSNIEVISGLKDDERVITAGAYLIQEGSKVELLEETGGL